MFRGVLRGKLQLPDPHLRQNIVHWHTPLLKCAGWLRVLLNDLHVFLPNRPALWCDNVSAISLASNPVYHVRTKHIKVDYHFVREKVLSKDLRVHYITSTDQVTDLFTKGLHPLTYQAKSGSQPICLTGAVDKSDTNQIESASVTT